MGRTDRDPAQPGTHGAFAAVAGCLAKGAEVGLLGGIFGFRPIPKDRKGDGTDPALGATNQFVEGTEISLLKESAK